MLRCVGGCAGVPRVAWRRVRRLPAAMVSDDNARACRPLVSQPRPWWPRPGAGTDAPRESGAPSPVRRVQPVHGPRLVPIDAASNAEEDLVMACASWEMEA